MTRQEALHELYTIFGYGFYNERVDEALNMAIKALEQKPSEDCIDRYSALAELHPLSYEYKAIKELPSVVPSRAEPKRGKWQRFNYSDGDVMECTNCGYRDWRDRWLEDEVHNYCPNCGARMESDEQ